MRLTAFYIKKQRLNQLKQILFQTSEDNLCHVNIFWWNLHQLFFDALEVNCATTKRYYCQIIEANYRLKNLLIATVDKISSLESFTSARGFDSIKTYQECILWHFQVIISCYFIFIKNMRLAVVAVSLVYRKIWFMNQDVSDRFSLFFKTFKIISNSCQLSQDLVSLKHFQFSNMLQCFTSKWKIPNCKLLVSSMRRLLRTARLHTFSFYQLLLKTRYQPRNFAKYAILMQKCRGMLIIPIKVYNG